MSIRTTTMSRSLSPSLRRELENLDKDADSRKSAMKALKSYVKDLDSKAIPIFLARVSETKDAGSSYGEFTISLYEVLARVHGPKIVPQIDNIMSTIIRTLATSAGTFALHQACSKVVPAIARYGIDPTMAEDRKRHIIHSLCKPLSDSLLGSHESLSSGSALCLKALVDSDNWRFASNDMVNDVCQRVAAAIEKPAQPNAHMGLVMALAKHNSFIVEAYARLFIQSGLRILNVGVSEANSQKRLSAIQMVNFLMKCLDPKSLFSELGLIMEEMERCQSDEMAYVSGAAFEALQTARKIINEKGSKLDKEMNGSTTGSNFDSSCGDSWTRNLWGSSGDQSPIGATSPESQTMSSFVGHDSLMESPISFSPFSGEYNIDRRSVNRKLWRRGENGGVDISLKDGLFSEVARGGSGIDNDKLKSEGSDYPKGFAGFYQGSPVRSTTPSPQRSRSQINVDDIKMFTTPRKLLHSLQDDDPTSESMYSEGATQRKLFRSPSCSKCGCTPTSKYAQNGFSQKRNDAGEIRNANDKFLGGSSESVSSTEDIVPANGDQFSPQIVSKLENQNQKVTNMSRNFKSPVGMMCGSIIILFAVFSYLLWIGDKSEGYLVPT